MYIKLQELLSVLTREEQEEFLKFVSQSSADKDTKKMPRLLYYIIKKEITDDETLIKKLYPSATKSNINAFRRLKNRAVREVKNFLLLQALAGQEATRVFLLAQFFRKRGKVKTALKFIKEAEQEAKNKENYHLLDSIYSEYILISLNSLEIDPNIYIKQREKNSEALNKLREIEDLVARLVYESKLEQAMNKYDKSLLASIRNKISEFSRSELFPKSYVFQKHLFQAISRLLLKENDYCELQKYCEETFRQIEFMKKYDEFRLELIIYIVNAAYKCRNTETIKKFYEVFKKEFPKYPPSLRDKYIFYTYYFDFVIGYLQNDLGAAETYLQEALNNELIKEHLIYRNFILLNLAVLYHNQQEHEKSLQTLNRIFIDPNYDKLALIFRLKIRAFEIMLLITLGEYELAVSIIERIRKAIRKEGNANIGLRYKEFISLLKKIANYFSSGKKNKKRLLASIAEFLEKHDDKHEDIINYNKWLSNFREKML